MPTLRDVKETALYVDNLERARRFYRDVMCLETLMEDPRFCAFDVAGQHILLIFARGKSLQDTAVPGGVVPAHDGAGPIHAGFAVEESEYEPWRRHLEQHGVSIVSEVRWPLGGRSLYFHDPDGHVLELLTPGVWRTY